MKLFKPKYYFTLTKFPHSLRLRVVHVLYLKKGLFHCDNNVYSKYLLTWPQAMRYQFLFWWRHLRGTMETMFPYKGKVNGYIKLEKIKNDTSTA